MADAGVLAELMIEIRNCGFENKGAHLMLLAIVERLRKAFPDADLTMAPGAPEGPQPFAKLTALGLYPKASLGRLGVEWGDLAAVVPKRLRRRYGLVLDREVDVVLDASGFAYSDQWGIESSLALARAARRWRRRGTRVILMPQAFGPFSGGAMRRAIGDAVDHADLVMPRDAVSYAHLTGVSGQRDHIRRYPDFTTLVEGTVPDAFEPDARGVAIVPNYRMIERTDAATSSRYVPFVAECVRRLIELGARPFLLVHEGPGDERLAAQIAEACAGTPIIRERDPLHIKGILGSCRAVVASRFHALVSALSQGVPAVATGWSHKYQELFEDYGFPQGVVSVDDDGVGLLLERLTDDASHAEIAARLREASARQKALAEEMWAAVYGVIDDSRS